MFSIETPRLVLRQTTPADARFAFDLNSDPEVLKYTGDEPFSSVFEAEEFLQAYDQYARFGYGRWLVILKETNKPIGWCGLKNQIEELGIVDLGYRFMRSQWGKGFATESAAASIEWGFANTDISSLVGRVAIGNRSSVRVLEKLGFEYEKDENCDDHPAQWFRLQREKWQNRF
jgi:ribosomal-protein-alanine N-acetyltransferase